MNPYREVFSAVFYEDLEQLLVSDKEKRMANDAIRVILSNPYSGSVRVQNSGGYWRKHIIGNRFRIFFEIDAEPRVVTFYRLKRKNKRTYK